MKNYKSFARAALSAATMFMLTTTSTLAEALEDGWQISKASGEIWVVDAEVEGQPAPAEHPLGETKQLMPGQSIRTGKNGRLLLLRGENSIFVQPSSHLTAPAETADGKTNILQRAGEVIFKVERKQTPHFEVQTPYLVALVKGTVFRVSLEKEKASVAVKEGRVQVADPKTGEFALVLPQQQASVSTTGTSGLAVAGSGEIGPIEKGAPFTAIKPIPAVARAADEAPPEFAGDHSAASRGLMLGIAIGLLGALGFAFIKTRFA